MAVRLEYIFQKRKDGPVTIWKMLIIMRHKESANLGLI